MEHPLSGKSICGAKKNFEEKSYAVLVPCQLTISKCTRL
jgi:hypothetical protein